MKTLIKLTVLVSSIFFANTMFSQSKDRIAIISIESNGLIKKQNEITTIVNLEFQKLQFYEVLERYDIKEFLKKSNTNIDSCLSISCLTSIGEDIGVEKVVSGSVQRIGEKIVFHIRIIDVKTGKVYKSQVNEYLNIETELQRMAELSIKKMHQIDVDPLVENYLVEKYNSVNPIPINNLKLNGPRMGVAFITGEIGKRLSANEENGGYNIIPMITQFGYQYEVQYLGSGNFQALFEFVGMVSGMEHQLFIPGITILNGFRNSKSGLEFAFGPTFGLRKTADGYYDENNKWCLTREFKFDSVYTSPKDKGYKIIYDNLDSRGEISLLTGWVWAVGKTFRSGHLNIPVNIYAIPRKEGWFAGVSVGFNIRKK